MTRILIAEDSTIMQKMLKVILEKDKSFEIVGIVADGEEACKKVLELKPDIILMDVRMPRMGGMEAIKKIMSETPTPIIVISSAEPPGEVKAQALKNGAVSFIEKPKALDFSSIANKIITDIRTLSRLKLQKKVFN
ncbi:MAG: response regulator [Candidatus Sericytochromatia bacterium]|nr:response regulator [Candidatus Sericytochromatia bacterium]